MKLRSGPAARLLAGCRCGYGAGIALSMRCKIVPIKGEGAKIKAVPPRAAGQGKRIRGAVAADSTALR